MRTILSFLVVMALGCGPETVAYCQVAPHNAPDGGTCPRANEGRGHCTADRRGIWYCGGGKWSVIHCPEGTSCITAGDGVGC
jgi:hypothetical protein